MAAPRVSVIVPVRNRRDLLVQLLDGLSAQTFRDFELVVVDDGSTDGCDDEVALRQAADPSLHLLRSAGAGAVTARRIGVANSSGEILAFTDSDCIPDARWLEVGVAAIDAGAGMVNGLTKPTRDVGPLERTTASATEGLYPTCNMFFRRDAYLRFGGFDEDAAGRLKFRPTERARGTGFGEDSILAWQLIRAGVPHVHVPQAVVEHHVFPADPVEWLSRGMQMAAFPALVKEVPELRETLLRRRFFLPPRNRLPVYVTFLALLLGRRRLVWCASLVWLASTLKLLDTMPGRWPRKLAWLPAEMALDGLVGAALLTGSARSRTVVL